MFNQNVQQVLQHEKEKIISIYCHSNESTFTQRAWEISDGKTCAVQLWNNKSLFAGFVSSFVQIDEILLLCRNLEIGFNWCKWAGESLG